MENSLDALMNAHLEPQATSTQPEGHSDNSDPQPAPAGTNRYLHNPEEGMKLCADLIARSNEKAPWQNTLNSINKLIDEDFLALAETSGNGLSTKTWERLQAFKQRLHNIASFPLLEQCYTVAVGGAFSAGKSRFLNSVLGCPSLLPTDTTPTTSIPTYISKGDQSRIIALNTYQKKTTIDEEALGAICHAFNDKFGVTFSHLLQLISVERETLKYPSLAFLDTPGYSKADNISDRAENTDENIARQQLSNANYLIWLVDIQNGTIPKPDIDFIASLETEQPVLFVFSKADKKPEAQVKAVIATAKKDLERAELPYHNVIAYSALTEQEISDTGQVLSSMLDTINSAKRGSTVIEEVDKLLTQHLSDFQSLKHSLKLSLATLRELLFDGHLSGDSQQHLSDLEQKTKNQADQITAHERTVTEIKQSLHDHLETLCQAVNLPTITHLHPVQLSTAGTYKSAQTAEQEPLTFNALIQGNNSELSKQHCLKSLEGYIEKISAVGVTIGNELGLTVLLTRPQVNKVLGNNRFEDYFKLNHSVTIQITGGNQCKLHVQPCIES